MFGLPDAKRVKRSEIFSSFASSENGAEADEADPEVASKLDTNRKTLKLDFEPDDGRISGTTEESHDCNATDETIQVNYGFEYEFIDKTQPPASNKPSNTTSTQQITQPDPTEPEFESQTYAFNLFAPKSKPVPNPTTTSPSSPSSHKPNTSTTTPTTQQQQYITLRPQTPPDPSLLPILLTQPGRLLKPRPQSHYFTTSLPPQTLQTLQSQYTTAAITGEFIKSTLSTTSWPGTHLPWRIISIPVHKLTLKDPEVNPGLGKGRALNNDNKQPPKQPGHRTRPSKKRRIQVRQRLAARNTAQTATSKATEEEEREKRTRRNREKKVKRKMREKAKKAATATDATIGTTTNDNANGAGAEARTGDEGGSEETNVHVNIDADGSK